MHVERTFTVPRPIEAVFDYLADFTHTEQWDPGTVSTTVTSGDGGLGTHYANVSQFLGRSVELDYETVQLDRPTEIRFAGTQASATSQDWLRLRRVSDGATEIHYRADFHFRGVVKLLAPLVIGRRLGGLADETVERLTQTLLAETA